MCLARVPSFTTACKEKNLRVHLQKQVDSVLLLSLTVDWANTIGFYLSQKKNYKVLLTS